MKIYEKFERKIKFLGTDPSLDPGCIYDAKIMIQVKPYLVKIIINNNQYHFMCLNDFFEAFQIVYD